MLAGLPLSRIPAANPPGRDPADDSRSSPQTDSPPDHAALVFQRFEGIELLHVQTAATSRVLVLGLQAVHQLVLHLLGPLYEEISTSSG